MEKRGVAMGRTPNIGFVYRQFSKTGIFMADYQTSKEAAEAADTSVSSVVRAAHGERRTGGGYIWRKVREEDPQEDIDVSHISRVGYHEKRPVIQLDKEGNQLGEYPSIAHACRELKISRRSLSCALNGSQHTAGGYYWKVKPEEAAADGE